VRSGGEGAEEEEWKRRGFGAVQKKMHTEITGEG